MAKCTSPIRRVHKKFLFRYLNILIFFNELKSYEKTWRFLRGQNCFEHQSSHKGYTSLMQAPMFQAGRQTSEFTPTEAPAGMGSIRKKDEGITYDQVTTKLSKWTTICYDIGHRAVEIIIQLSNYLLQTFLPITKVA